MAGNDHQCSWVSIPSSPKKDRITQLQSCQKQCQGNAPRWHIDLMEPNTMSETLDLEGSGFLLLFATFFRIVFLINSGNKLVCGHWALMHRAESHLGCKLQAASLHPAEFGCGASPAPLPCQPSQTHPEMHQLLQMRKTGLWRPAQGPENLTAPQGALYNVFQLREESLLL